jgi:hypothetical protein
LYGIFNPQNILNIPAVKHFIRLELEQKLTFCNSLFISFDLLHHGTIVAFDNYTKRKPENNSLFSEFTMFSNSCY